MPERIVFLLDGGFYEKSLLYNSSLRTNTFLFGLRELRLGSSEIHSSQKFTFYTNESCLKPNFFFIEIRMNTLLSEKNHVFKLLLQVRLLDFTEMG